MANCNTIRGNCFPSDHNDACGCDMRVKRCGSNNIDLSRARFMNAPDDLCPCRLEEAQSLADNGFEVWRLDPVDTASRYLNNCFIDPCFRGYPAYLVAECKTCCKTYVVLGVSCAGCLIFELCQPVRQGDGGIWKVERYGRYCPS